MRATIVDPPRLPAAYDVLVGWNMVAFKSTSANVPAEHYLDGMGYARIYGPKDDTWFAIPGPGYDNPEMEPRGGYWVPFTEPRTIHP